MPKQTISTTKGYAPNVKRAQLECSHFFYYKVGKLNDGDTVFCRLCNDFREVGDKEARYATILDFEDMFTSVPGKQGKGWYHGECMYDDCNYTTTVKGFQALKLRMHAHLVGTHTDIGKVDPSLFEDVEPPTPGRKEPPF